MAVRDRKLEKNLCMTNLYDYSMLEDTDGSKDSIDCGSGNDEAWINISQDGDTAVNCETVHSDINP